MDFKELDNSKKEEKPVTMEDLNLPVGTRLQLITLGRQKGEYYSSLIGFEPQQYIFIKMPQENGFNIRLGVAEHVEVRVFTGISILKFSSSVEFIYQTPRNFVELAYPDSIQVIPLREDIRIDLKTPARIWQINGQKLGKAKPATLLDLSITGTMLQSASYVGEVGEEIGIAFIIQNTITREDMVVNTITTIRNSREEKNASGDTTYRYGLLFKELRPFYQATLQNFINDQLLRDRKVIF